MKTPKKRKRSRLIRGYRQQGESPEASKPANSIVWHSISEAELFERLKTSPGGLSVDESERRLKEFGPNVLPMRRPPSIIEIFVRQFLSPLIYVLIAAGLVALFLDETLDATFIFIVVMINAIIGTLQEMKAEKSAERLQQLLKASARVRRSGKEFVIPAENLVPGDLVVLESGNKVPADIRLISLSNFTVDESLLTGESIPVEKAVTLLPEETVVSDRKNIAFAGTTVSSGRALGIVVATGIETEIGRIAEVVTSTESAKPPLIQRLERFSKQISLIVVGAALLLAIVAAVKGMPLDEVFFLAVALAVSAIPEGLPVAVTVALVVRVTKMSRRNVLVRRLAAVESLGSCTCIASDKTGTLTVNMQTVKLVYLPVDSKFHVTGEGYSVRGEVTRLSESPIGSVDMERLREFAVASTLCNDASLTISGDDLAATGDAVDISFLVFAHKVGIDPSDLRTKFPIIGEIPFESERRYAAKSYLIDGKVRVFVKGSVEVVLDFCKMMRTNNGISQIDKKVIEDEASSMASNGYRVLAVASGETEINPDGNPLGEEGIPPLTFLGLAGLIDPPRPEVKKAVETCKCAGIDVVMVTGDHPSTALAIARNLGIAESENEVVTGSQLSQVNSSDDREFVDLVKGKKVFARVTPVQKLQIVDALMKIGHFVAVTGDGVNDAPALRKANIGVAMGSGTDVAKDAASIIITDDNFASIVAGVEEGRYAYENIRKVTYLLVSTGAAEILLFILAIFIGIKAEGVHLAIPLLAIQLLWLNVVTNGIQHVVLAMEAGDPGVMRKPPRNPSEGIFDKLMIRQVALSSITMGSLAFILFYYLIVVDGRSYFEASNLTFLFMVLLENVHVFNCRSEYESAFRVPISKNYYLLLGVLGAQGIHILAMHVPVMQEVLRIEPVSMEEWLMLLSLAVILLLVMEVFKVFVRKKQKRISCQG
ncbi:MAG: HAD-IC family P-type ATPase [Methanomassiliicoccales archaeon]|jgi:magnesium-transporting ATPase (P-type)|nr:HAD-IC family P-type ATPase [Methanomassiliicoccales archaeon]